MARAVVPPVAPVSPDLSGGAPHFSAKLGAWIRPLHTDERALSGSRSKRYGNVTLNQKVKWWVAVLIWNLACWGLLLGVYVSFFHRSGR